jgi:hypothetical protein
MSQFPLSAFYGCPDATDRHTDNAFFACNATIRDLRKLIRGFQSGIVIKKYRNTGEAAKHGYLDVLMHLHCLGRKINMYNFIGYFS